MEDMMEEMLSSQQSMRSEMQSSNEVVQGMQSAQKEQKANIDMLNKQLSQLATSVGELRGNSGKLPSTVHIPEKANMSKVTLRSGTTYSGPEMKKMKEKPSKGEKEETLLPRGKTHSRIGSVTEPPAEAKKKDSEEVVKILREVVRGEKPFPYRFLTKRKKGDEMAEPMGTSHRYQQRNRGRRRNQNARDAEFQESVTQQLEQLQTSHTELSNRVDERWDQQQSQWVQHQQWHGEWNQTWDQHQQNLNQWEQFQTNQWNAMCDRDMHSARVLEEVQREQRESREQLDHLTAMMNQWNTNFFSNYPPHPPPQ